MQKSVWPGYVLLKIVMQLYILWVYLSPFYSVGEQVKPPWSFVRCRNRRKIPEILVRKSWLADDVAPILRVLTVNEVVQ